jgi:hypothetical protein
VDTQLHAHAAHAALLFKSVYCVLTALVKVYKRWRRGYLPPVFMALVRVQVKKLKVVSSEDYFAD